VPSRSARRPDWRPLALISAIATRSAAGSASSSANAVSDCGSRVRASSRSTRAATWGRIAAGARGAVARMPCSRPEAAARVSRSCSVQVATLAYTLTSGRDCAEIHALHDAGEVQPLLDSYYFSAFMGAPTAHEGVPQEQDRLLRLLRETDVAAVPQPQLDRRIDYTGLIDDRAMVSFDGRSDRDRQLLSTQFSQLSRSAAGGPEDAFTHRLHLNAARRLLYFELRDEARAERMLPYPSALRFLSLLDSPTAAASARDELLYALNRGEGLASPDRIGQALALKLRDVPLGTVRSFRLFPADAFTLEPGDAPVSAYIEGSRTSLQLRYRDPGGRLDAQAELVIRLDLFELLQRFAQGYRPGIADTRGQQLALAVFKNRLASVPYQEVLLTAHGHDLRRVRRTPDHVLHLEDLSPVPADQAEEETWR
jgi:hypothetical protein